MTDLLAGTTVRDMIQVKGASGMDGSAFIKGAATSNSAHWCQLYVDSIASHAAVPTECLHQQPVLTQ